MLYLGPNEVTELKKVKTVIVNGQVIVDGTPHDYYSPGTPSLFFVNQEIYSFENR